MDFDVHTIFAGFSGKLGEFSLGWGTCALITNGETNVLFDTGGPTIRNQMNALLAKHKISQYDIQTVVLSHLHFDHTYNIDLFPNAEFVFSEADWDYICSNETCDPFIDGKTIFLLKNLKHRVIKQEEELYKGLNIIMTPGHTPGSMSLIVERQNANWLLSGDAVKNRGELRTEEVQMTLNASQTSNSIKRIKRIASRVLPGHDGWLKLENNRIIPEGGNDIELVFAQGVTVNNGKTRITISMD